MHKLAIAIGKIGFEFIRPFIAPILAYFKGRSDAKRDLELRNMKRDDELIDDALIAGRDADNGRLHDKHFRD